MKNEEDVPVKSGGLKITDFEDLKIAFVELSKRHNELARSYNEYRKVHFSRDFMETPYGL